VCLATSARLREEAVGLVEEVIVTVLAVLREQQMDRETEMLDSAEAS
jgi:hypothetical protein